MAEKSSSQVSRALREQYEKGKAAFERDNLDYAISILGTVLRQEPAFYECREALRASQFKRAGGGSGTGFFKRFLGSTNPKVVQAQMALKNNPLEAINLAEDVLNGDPNNLAAHKVLAHAAMAADLPRTAVLSLEIVMKQSPGDNEAALELARALTRAGQGEKAEAILGGMVDADPDNMELAQALKDAAASRTLVEGGYEALSDGQGSYRDILRNEEEAITLEQEKRDYKPEEVTERLIREYEARLATEPGNLRLVRSIAELHAQRKDFDRALEYYARLTSVEAADPSLERAIAETHVKKFDHLLSQLDPQSADYAEQEAGLKAEKQRFVLADCRRRVERYPNDLQQRFEMGQICYEAGLLSEAIQEFQKAQNNPHRRIQSLYYLGLCFGAKGMHDLAARSFQTAIREKTVFDDEKKELIYSLGCAFEKMGRQEEAVEQLKLIYEADIGYRDVGAKVDAYYASKQQG